MKAEAEAAVLNLGFRGAYAIRPGFIQPMRGVTSRMRSLRWMYALTAPVYSLGLTRQPVELFGGCLVLANSLSAWAPGACRDGNHRDLTIARISRFSKIRPLVSRFILTLSLLAFNTLP